MKNVFTFLLLLFSLLCNGQSPKLFTTDKELSSSLINQNIKTGTVSFGLQQKMV